MESFEEFKEVVRKDVEYLLDNPDKIEDAWNNPNVKKGGILFTYVSPDMTYNGLNAGCLTQIKMGVFNAELTRIPRRDKLITEFIVNDKKLPADWNDIGVEDLSRFASYQLAFQKYRETKDFDTLVETLETIKEQ